MGRAKGPRSDVDLLLEALADPTRRAIVWMLSESKVRVPQPEIAAQLGLSAESASHHLSRLEKAGILQRVLAAEGKAYRCSLVDTEVLQNTIKWLESLRFLPREPITEYRGRRWPKDSKDLQAFRPIDCTCQSDPVGRCVVHNGKSPM
jgi:DNA-binding transcriptional ArsR family regulator